MFCRRFSGNPSLSLIATIFIIVIFITKQAKDLYEKNQKHHRMENYNKFMNEVSSSMQALGGSANKSSVALHQLMGVLQNHRPQSDSSFR